MTLIQTVSNSLLPLPAVAPALPPPPSAAVPVSSATVTVAQKTSVPLSAPVNNAAAAASIPGSVLNSNNNTFSSSSSSSSSVQINNNLPHNQPIDQQAVNKPPAIMQQPSPALTNSKYHIPASVIASQPAPNASKKGIKRKADTTTLEPPNYAAEALPGHPAGGMIANDDVKPTKMSTRRESGRPIKKPSKELPNLNLPGAPILKKSSSKKGKMSERMKYCAGILKDLFTKKHADYAWPFYKPVDVEGLHLDDYFDVIKKPMDLGTAKAKMENREYRKAEDFAADIRLIFTNCYKYNPPDHEIVHMGRKLQVGGWCLYASFYGKAAVLLLCAIYC